MLYLLHRISYVCTVLSCVGKDNLRRRAMGVAFLKPGSNSARPPPRGGHMLYIHDAPSVYRSYRSYRSCRRRSRRNASTSACFSCRQRQFVSVRELVVSLFSSLVYRIAKFSLSYRLRVRRTLSGILIRFCAYFVPYPVQFGAMEL